VNFQSQSKLHWKYNLLLQEWNLSQNLLTASLTDNVVAAMGSYSSGLIYSIWSFTEASCQQGSSYSSYLQSMCQGKMLCQPLPSFYQLVIPPDLEAAGLET